MNYDWLVYEFATTSSLKLMRAEMAPLIIHFLASLFTNPSRVSVPLSEFLDRLEEYLALRHQDLPSQHFQSAHEYVSIWADDEHHFIKVLLLPPHDQSVVELTADTLQVLTWIEQLHAPFFIGTGSRLLSIVQCLKEIVHEVLEDAPARLKRLKQDRDAIQHQIDQIILTGNVDPQFTKTQLRERFRTVCNTAHQLLGDFLLVERRFHAIAHSIAQRSVLAETPKGVLITQVLDAHDALRQTDEGQSFYTFQSFLTNPTHMDQLSSLIQQTLNIAFLSPTREDVLLLSHLPQSLLAYDEKIVLSIDNLANQLLYILSNSVMTENVRLGTILSELKRAMRSLGDRQAIALSDPCIPLPGLIEVRIYPSVHLWEPESAENVSSFKDFPVIDSRNPSGPQEEELNELLAGQLILDESLLQDRIRAMLLVSPQVTLGTILTHYPLTQGLEEILAYGAIADADIHHTIDDSKSEQIPFRYAFPLDTLERFLNLPCITYYRSQDATSSQEDEL